jgi:hypothetical protein
MKLLGNLSLNTIPGEPIEYGIFISLPGKVSRKRFGRRGLCILAREKYPRKGDGADVVAFSAFEVNAVSAKCY